MHAHRIAVPAVLVATVMVGCSLLNIGTPTAEVGDCFNTDGGEGEVAGISARPCDEPHVYEAYGVFDYPTDNGDDYPGDSAIQTYADDHCKAQFTEYVGVAYDDSIWFSTSITPSEDTWGAGDREIICALHKEDESEVTGSARGSNE
jgi:Septum formation